MATISTTTTLRNEGAPLDADAVGEFYTEHVGRWVKGEPTGVRKYTDEHGAITALEVTREVTV